jgi:hypothetical protein
MNREIIRDENKWLLEAINEQCETIHRYGEKIPQIEFDILMENVRKFYENLHLLKRFHEPNVSQEPKSKSPDAGQPIAGTSVGNREYINPGVAAAPPAVPSSSGVKVTFSEPVPDIPVHTLPPEQDFLPSPASPVQFKPAGPATVRQEPATAKKAGKPMEIDLFAAEEPAFSIKLKDAREKSLGPKVPSEHIENLKTAITINEKFMFINELFDGNLREYNETIETLNGFKSLDTAADFLDLMRKKNFWNTGSNAFKKLKELVERKF